MYKANVKEDIMKKIGILFAFILCFGVLTGCKSTESVNVEEIYGKWIKIEDTLTTTYVLNEDGTFKNVVESTAIIDETSTGTGTYKFDGKVIKLYSEEFDYEYSYKVTLDGDTMIWANNMTEMVYVRQN